MKYKGLNIPRGSKKVSIRNRQRIFCDNANGASCLGQCNSCLFDGRNLKQFKEWFKEKSN